MKKIVFALLVSTLTSGTALAVTGPTIGAYCHMEGRLGQNIATERLAGRTKAQVEAQLTRDGGVPRPLQSVIDRAFATTVPPRLFGLEETLRCDQDHGMNIP